MLYSYRAVILMCLIILFLVACGRGGRTVDRPPSVPIEANNSVDASNNQALFAANGCTACHALDAGADGPDIGPALAGIATRGADRIANPNYSGQATTVEAYIRESILDPKIYLVEGYDPLMPDTYQAALSQEDLDKLVKFLTSLK